MLRLITIILFGIGLANADILPGWETTNPQSDVKIDHSEWQQLLAECLVTDEFGQTYFKYSHINEEQRVTLSNYISSLEAVDPLSLNPNEEKAYWINLYNALTVDVILDHYPLESIRDIGSSFGGLIPGGPWDLEVATINRQALTLNNIEHDIVRPKFDDFRIHFALNCAAKGCPNLSTEAYTSDNIDDLLDKSNAAFVNHQRGVRFQNGRLVLSKIYDWYLTDFVEDEDDLPAFLSEFADARMQAQLSGYTGRIRYEYDWSLNEASNL